MALTRNQRRKMARERQLAKAVRVANAIETREREARQAIAANLNSPRPRNIGWSKVRSCLDGIAGSSHRGYVCQNEKRPSLLSIDDRGMMR
jgi:hypothetical protein